MSSQRPVRISLEERQEMFVSTPQTSVWNSGDQPERTFVDVLGPADLTAVGKEATLESLSSSTGSGRHMFFCWRMRPRRIGRFLSVTAQGNMDADDAH
jgi:hypothetical protein